MKTQINPSHKLTPIEGLRGYLALAVILQHVAFAAGCDGAHPILRNIGSLAVKCFVIISGFVIFFLIDTRPEPYKIYITRRFFRIFPILAVLYAASIFCSILAYHTLQQCSASGWFTPQEIAEQTQEYLSCWKNLPAHVLAHLFMLHGLIPQKILPYSSVAFLGPAWKGAMMYAFCLVCILGCNHFFSWLNNPNDAALPFYLEFFFFGIVSYFLYKMLVHHDIRQRAAFPVAVLLCLVVYKWSDPGTGLIPFLLWASFFALMVEPTASVSARFVTPVFTNPVSLWLGKVSYSIYLSHTLVLIVVQWALFSLFPHASQAQHFLMLASLTIVLTVLASGFLYYLIEAPFIKLGSRLVKGMRQAKGINVLASKLGQTEKP